MTAYLHGLSTALPPHCLDQSEVKDRAAAIFGKTYPQFDRLFRTFETAGIEKRYSVVPIDWFSSPRGWKERNDSYGKGARALFVEAAEAALADAGWTSDEVDCVVTVSSTGIATPTLEAQVFSRMGFRDDILRVPVFGLGCAGGVSGLSIAQSIADGRAGAKVLLVVIETCSLAFRADRLQKADIIATVLFGDGAAAACVSTGNPRGQRRIALDPGHQKIWPDTLGIMGWDVDDTGLGVVFDRSIPGFVSEEFAAASAWALGQAGHTHDAIDRFVCHPGGAKVIAAIEAALHLEPGYLDAERQVLRDAGNMSAPTVLFVLKALLDDGASGQMMACALGPGFTASYLPLRVEAT